MFFTRVLLFLPLFRVVRGQVGSTYSIVFLSLLPDGV